MRGRWSLPTPPPAAQGQQHGLQRARVGIDVEGPRQPARVAGCGFGAGLGGGDIARPQLQPGLRQLHMPRNGVGVRAAVAAPRDVALQRRAHPGQADQRRHRAALVPARQAVGGSRARACVSRPARRGAGRRACAPSTSQQRAGERHAVEGAVGEQGVDGAAASGRLRRPAHAVVGARRALGAVVAAGGEGAAARAVASMALSSPTASRPAAHAPAAAGRAVLLRGGKRSSSSCSTATWPPLTMSSAASASASAPRSRPAPAAASRHAAPCRLRRRRRGAAGPAAAAALALEAGLERLAEQVVQAPVGSAASRRVVNRPARSIASSRSAACASPVSARSAWRSAPAVRTEQQEVAQFGPSRSMTSARGSRRRAVDYRRGMGDRWHRGRRARKAFSARRRPTGQPALAAAAVDGVAANPSAAPSACARRLEAQSGMRNSAISSRARNGPAPAAVRRGCDGQRPAPAQALEHDVDELVGLRVGDAVQVVDDDDAVRHVAGIEALMTSIAILRRCAAYRHRPPPAAGRRVR